jgi:hypothetical protein
MVKLSHYGGSDGFGESSGFRVGEVVGRIGCLEKSLCTGCCSEKNEMELLMVREEMGRTWLNGPVTFGDLAAKSLDPTYILGFIALIEVFARWDILALFESFKFGVIFAQLIVRVGFVSCVCASEDLQTGNFSAAFSSTDGKSCYWFVDCTFNDIADTPVTVSVSNADMAATGCLFVDCRPAAVKGAGCFYLSGIRPWMLRTCCQRCSGISGDGAGFCSHYGLKVLYFEEISFWKQYDPRGGTWVWGGMTGATWFTNVNVSDYCPTATGRSRGLLTSTHGTLDSGASYTHSFMIFADCSAGSVYAIEVVNLQFTMQRCIMSNCSLKNYVFETWGNAYCRFQDCIFDVTGTFHKATTGAAYFTLWNCMFSFVGGLPAAQQAATTYYSNLEGYTYFRRLHPVVGDSVCVKLYEVEAGEKGPTGAPVHGWCSSYPIHAENEHWELGGSGIYGSRLTGAGDSNLCCSIRSCTFVEIVTEANGGAVSFASTNTAYAKSDAYVSDSQFLSCTTGNSANYKGGAIYFQVDASRLIRCCGSLCISHAGTFMSLDKTTGVLDLLDCSLWRCGTVDSDNAGGSGVVSIMWDICRFYNTNFSYCFQKTGAAILEYTADNSGTSTLPVPVSRFITCLHCSGVYGFYFRYRYLQQELCVYVAISLKAGTTNSGWFRISSYYAWFIFCMFEDYGDTVLFYYPSSRTTLNLMECQLSGVCPTQVSNVGLQTIFVKEQATMTYTLWMAVNSICHDVFLVFTDSFTLSNGFRASSSLSSSKPPAETKKGFSGTGFLPITISFSGTTTFRGSNSFSDSNVYNQSSSFSSSDMFTSSDSLLQTNSFSNSGELSVTHDLSKTGLLSQSSVESRSIGFTESDHLGHLDFL